MRQQCCSTNAESSTGPIRDLVPLGLWFLAFFDPDGIALELTAPLADSG